MSSLTSKLRTQLSADLLAAQGVSLSLGFNNYTVHLPSDVWIDLESGTSALDRAEGALRAGQPTNMLGPATVAASIARRPFLAGIDGFWPEAQRSKLERQLLRSLDCICQMKIQIGEPASAVETALEAVALDPYRELSHQHLMQAYAATGNRAKAIGVYHEFSKLLTDDLGSDASPEIEALYIELLG